MQAADLLGIRTEVRELLTYQSAHGGQEVEPLHIIALRNRVYRSLMNGVCDVRVATSKIERELTYTYDLYRREVRKVAKVSQMFNLLNFAQFSVLYSLEGLSRRKNQFNQSAVLTGVSAGLGIILPTMNILYSKLAKRKTAPPERFTMMVEGKPVTELRFPDLIVRFLETRAPGASVTRKEEMYSTWKDRYGTDAMAKEGLFSLIDGKRKGKGELYRRIVHLWSLHTFVQEFDEDLLALLRSVHPPETSVVKGDLASSGLNKNGVAACKLLGIEGELAEFLALGQSQRESERRLQLETYLIGEILLASLELRTAADRCYEDMNYAIDVVLAALEARRARLLQLSYETNFIQINTFGAIACYSYFKNHTKAGNELFTIGGAVGIALTSLGVLLLRGGKRKVDTPPNLLADFFELRPESKRWLSPFTRAFLDAPSPESTAGLTNKEQIEYVWKSHKIATINTDKRKNQEKLAAMPSVKNDTIHVTRNRIALLNSLRIQFQLLDRDLYDVLKLMGKQEPECLRGTTPAAKFKSDRSAQIAGMLELGPYIDAVREARATNTTLSTYLVDLDLTITRRILEAMLDVRKTNANVELEIGRNQDRLDRLERYKNTAVQVTNLGNFYQIGILGVIADGGFGLTSYKNANLYNERLTIIEGLTAGGLAVIAYLLGRGGFSLTRPEPNMLGPCLGMESPAKKRYAPLLLKFLNLPDPESPGGRARAAVLLDYWQSMHLLNVNMKKRSNYDKVAAHGKHHHFWNENINTIRSRVTMLFDLEAMVNLMENDLALLLREVS